MHTVHTHTHTYYVPIHIYHMHALIPIAYSTYHYYTLYTICLYTHTLTTYTTYHTHTLIYTHPYISYGYICTTLYTQSLVCTTLYTGPCYIPMLYARYLYATHCNMHPCCYVLNHRLHIYINTPLYKHRLITISHICHTQAPYKYIDIWGINRPIII